MRLQDNPVGDRVAKMRRNLSRPPYTQPDQVRMSSLGMSKDALHGISKIDHEFSLASRIDVRRKDALHLLAQRLCQGRCVRVGGGLDG